MASLNWSPPERSARQESARLAPDTSFHRPPEVVLRTNGGGPPPLPGMQVPALIDILAQTGTPFHNRNSFSNDWLGNKSTDRVNKMKMVHKACPWDGSR